MKAKLASRPARDAAARSKGRPARPRHSGRPVPASLDAAAIVRLQAFAGNQAVGQLLAGSRLSVQRQAACPVAPPPPASVSPHDDPRFVTVASNVNREAAKQKEHPPARAKVDETARAAVGPSNEVTSKAAAAQVDDMSQKRPRGFDKAAFIAAVHEAIAKATPKNMEEVDDFSKSGKAGQLKGQVVGKVGQGKDDAAKEVKDANAATPDTSRAAPKPVTPMGPESPGPPPGDVRAGAAMPGPRPADQISLDHGPCETDSQLAEANVTREQVAKSNEPQFQEAMAAKDRADEHAATAPQQFRQDEQGVLGQAQGQAAGTASTGLAQMHQGRTSVLGHVASHKDEAKAKNEAERARVATEIEAIYNATKKDVDAILQGLDGKVATAFDTGEKAARNAFENDYKTKKDAYFDKRYSGISGAALWIEDKLTSPPPEVNRFIEQAKQVYVTQMERVIGDVAEIVERELTSATNRIKDGRRQINDYVAKQPKALQQVAQEAAGKFESKFDELDQAVTDKSNSVVDDLAQKYVTAAQQVDERCNAMREENKGLLDKAKDKISGMVETLQKMKAMLAALAAKAASVVDQILQDPIGFLHNLIAAVKMGLGQFVANIGKHLMEGLMGWLLGELADAGITMPESFDLKGILSMVAQVLGLTWANIRARAVAILGEEVVGQIEQGVEAFKKIFAIFQTIKNEGLAGLWHMIQDKIGDLKAAVLDQIQDFVITKVITAGVTWIVSLLNPASAFVKACKAIYDIVMFFVERGSQIIALVNAILDNLAAIASGNLGAAANLVESVLAKALPIAISFLASLLGLGGISEKIKEIINAVRKPIFKAADWVIKTVVAPVAKAAAKAIGWVKAKVKAGVDWLKKKGKAAVDKIKSKFGKKKDEADGALAEPVSVVFSMHGAGHRLTTTSSGTVEMASAGPGDIRAKIGLALASARRQREAIEAARSELRELEASGRSAVRRQALRCFVQCAEAPGRRGGASQVEELDAIAGLEAKVEAVVRGRRGKAKVEAQLLQLANKLESYATRWNLSDLGPMAEAPPKDVGAAMRYSDAASGREETFGTLEAEHIVPGKILNILVRGLSGRRLHTDEAYRGATTLLIPELMADIKTHEGAGGSASDRRMIDRVKATAGRVNRRLREGKPVDPGDIVQINDLFANRIEATKRARDEAIARVLSGTEKAPGRMARSTFADEMRERLSDAKIEQAAMRQLQELWNLAKGAEAASRGSPARPAEGDAECKCAS